MFLQRNVDYSYSHHSHRLSPILPPTPPSLSLSHTHTHHSLSTQKCVQGANAVDMHG